MNIKEIKELVKILDGTDIVEFTFEGEEQKISIKKGVVGAAPVYQSNYPVVSVPSINSTVAELSGSAAVPDDEGTEISLAPNQVYITAPMVGVFYQSPSPESAPYVKVGQVVEQEDVLCIIEAMKLMNEIESEYRGRIVEILVSDAQPVEFGQPLFIMEKL